MAVPFSSNVTTPTSTPNKRRRSMRTRKETAAEGEMDLDSAGETDHDESDNVPSPAESSQDEFEDVAPAKKPRKSAIKGTSNRTKKKNVQIIRDNGTENALYETLTEATVDVPTAVQEWLGSYVDDRHESLQTLINCLIKTTGCQQSITADQAVDFDGIPDVIDSLERSFKSQSNTVYPLIHRAGNLKKIGVAITKFLDELVKSSSESLTLYEESENGETLMETLQHWITSLTSSPLRAFRHTATVWGLSLSSALCKLARDFDKQFSKESSRRQTSNKSETLLSRKTTVENFIQEVTDGVFIHRYRDIEPIIRSECVKALGFWMKTWPNHFLEGNYLRYTGWLLSDTDASVRHAAIDSLVPLYSSEEHLTQLQHFTDRFKQRLIEISLRDIDASVKISSLKLITAIDNHELLEDDERMQISKLAFDLNPKVRKACGGFWQTLVDDEQKRLVGTAPNMNVNNYDIEQLGTIKAFTSLLVTSTRIIDGPEKRRTGNEAGSRLRIALDDLWSSLDVVRDWKAMLDTLIIDHSTIDDNFSQFKLTEDEEDMLVELFCACVNHIHDESDAASDTSIRRKKKPVVGDELTKVSRQLIQDLPNLYSKHQAIPSRMADLLTLPRAMELTLYLDMRMEGAFESLYNEISQQFQKHSLPSVLEAATESIFALNNANVLVNISERNYDALVYNLVSSLKSLVSGQEIENADIDEDSANRIQSALLRFVFISTRVKLGDTMDESAGDDASVSQIVLALATRGALGYEIEAKMVENALQLLFLNLLWRASDLVKMEAITTEREDSEYEIKLSQLNQSRDDLYQLVVDLSVGSTSNSTESVKSKAFKILMELAILFTNGRSKEFSTGISKHSSIEFSEEIQLRCMGYVEAEIEQFAQDCRFNADEGNEEDDDEVSEGDDSSDDEAQSKTKKKTKATSKAKQSKKTKKQESTLALQPDHIDKTYEFSEMIAVTVKSIRLGVMPIDKLPVILAHHGRFGVLFDSLNKLALDAIREISLYAGSEYYLGIVQVISSSLVSAHKLLLEGKVDDDSHLISLGRSLSSSLIVRGAQLKIVKKTSPNVIVAIHKRVLTDLVDNLKPVVGEQRKNAAKISQINSGFKALHHLLAAGPSGLIEGKHVLEVKNFYDELLKSAEIAVGTSSKIWDGARSYEKKLVNLIAKDKNLVRHTEDGDASMVRQARPRAVATAAKELSKDMVESDEESDDNSENEHAEEQDEEPENDAEENDETVEPEGEKGGVASSSPLSKLPEEEDDESENVSSQMSKKRSRQSDVQPEMESPTKEEDGRRVEECIELDKARRRSNSRDSMLGLELIDGYSVREWLGSKGEGDITASDDGVKLDMTAIGLDRQTLMKLVGEQIGKLHLSGIIHGDLTTSNLILKHSTKEVYIIDFGLSSLKPINHYTSAEDRAVDIYVLERAFGSTHPSLNKEYSQLLESYADTLKSSEWNKIICLVVLLATSPSSATASATTTASSAPTALLPL
ncbi:hypothetical protein E3Q23_00093 [Wallemia mellicola]|uniref:Uncharacterized protein n=1 Tax=Wallemia mellicola TaxID=1708541 RepID=A0A4T0U0M0_9BASI|nr:hypothetical protein E3Q23_00093 [Wallemia mellicola]TIC08195.1 hypothetical protein E3Q16_00136 [Wallemia mellicola]TIC70057.1 hypothetical protein E3Q01_00174 [Wallemia mellicola]TIC71262.1 hypothetical protein E3Q02_00172 [Wallemia mellicola]